MWVTVISTVVRVLGMVLKSLKEKQKTGGTGKQR